MKAQVYLALRISVWRRPQPRFHELTVRLRDDDGQLVPPSEFIPAAERYNVMSIIDRWVVTRAVELLKERLEQGAPLPLLAVNLSGTTSTSSNTFNIAKHANVTVNGIAPGNTGNLTGQVGALPTWPYSAGWGVYPSGGLGLIVVILLILILLGKV